MSRESKRNAGGRKIAVCQKKKEVEKITDVCRYIGKKLFWRETKRREREEKGKELGDKKKRERKG